MRQRLALARFAEKCRFEPATGCVVWTGGTTSGRGHNTLYGSFWFERRRWFAHRWSAKHIHGLTIDGLQVDHCCSFLNTPDTLCVEHLQAVPPSVNRELQWIRTQVGCEGFDYPYPDLVRDPTDPPFFSPPAWFVEYGPCTMEPLGCP